MEYENILLGVENEIGILMINRPKVLNALNVETLNEIQRGLREMKENPAIRVLIITGAGEKAFVAGADIAAFRELTPLQALDFALHGQGVLARIESLPQPVIGAVNGYALGGGCELAMACDLLIAAEAIPGKYQLIAGMYDLATGKTLPWHSAEGRDLGPYFPLGTVEVQP